MKSFSKKFNLKAVAQYCMGDTFLKAHNIDDPHAPYGRWIAALALAGGLVLGGMDLAHGGSVKDAALIAGGAGAAALLCVWIGVLTETGTEKLAVFDAKKKPQAPEKASLQPQSP